MTEVTLNLGLELDRQPYNVSNLKWNLNHE